MYYAVAQTIKERASDIVARVMDVIHQAEKQQRSMACVLLKRYDDLIYASIMGMLLKMGYRAFVVFEGDAVRQCELDGVRMYVRLPKIKREK